MRKLAEERNPKVLSALQHGLLLCSSLKIIEDGTLFRCLRDRLSIEAAIVIEQGRLSPRLKADVVRGQIILVSDRSIAGSGAILEAGAHIALGHLIGRQELAIPVHPLNNSFFGSAA